jgi:hypothetical protein
MMVLIVMLFAHPTEDGLFCAAINRTKLLLCAMGYTFSALNGNLVTAVIVTSLSCWTMRATQASLFHILIAACMSALLSLGSMRDT